MAKLAYAADSKSAGSDTMWVQFPPLAPSVKTKDTKMHKLEFNINDHVYVKLTDVGKERLKKNYVEYCDHLRSMGGSYPFEFSLPTEDENGWSRWQLWELMNEFGSHLYTGCPTYFESNKIRVSAGDVVSRFID